MTNWRRDTSGMLLGVLILGYGGQALAGTTCAPNILASSTFNANLQGWTSNTPAEVSWVSSGSGAGYAQFTDMTNASTYIDAPATFHGNFTALNNTGYLTYQHKIISETGVTAYSPYEVRMSGPGGAAKFDGATPTTTTTPWVIVVAPFSIGDWTVTSGTWGALLANVTDVQIDIELVTNAQIPGDTDIEGIDNVYLVQLTCAL